MELYLDSNVFISFVREEIDSAFNLRYIDSEAFFTAIKKCEYQLLISAFFFKEVEKIVSLEKKAVLEEFQKLGITVKVLENKPSSETIAKISVEYKLHAADCIHVAFALNSKANFIITWNKKDFQKTEKLVKCLTPAEFLETLLPTGPFPQQKVLP